MLFQAERPYRFVHLLIRNQPLEAIHKKHPRSNYLIGQKMTLFSLTQKVYDFASQFLHIRKAEAPCLVVAHLLSSKRKRLSGKDAFLQPFYYNKLMNGNTCLSVHFLLSLLFPFSTF